MKRSCSLFYHSELFCEAFMQKISNLSAMPAKKSSFSNLVVHKKSKSNLHSDQLVFCKDGKSIIVPRGQTCHLYDVSTGDHVKELFACTENIISCQLHPLSENSIIAATEDGMVVTFNLETCKIENQVNLVINPTVINSQIAFHKKWDRKSVDWTKVPVNDFNNRKFYCISVKPFVTNERSYLVVWGSWGLKDDRHCHVTGFIFENGEHFRYLQTSSWKLSKRHKNFTYQSYELSDLFVGFNEKFAIIVLYNRENYEFKFKKHYFVQKAAVTCLAVNPNEHSFATGDITGRITVWTNIFDKNPSKGVYHWHTLPVKDVAYSDTGSYLYSGGEENVLVKWALDSTEKNFLPRLDSAIFSIQVSYDTSLMAISTLDNRILITNGQFKQISVIQHFSKWSAVEFGKNLNIFTTDPRTDSFVLNGKRGHIQFLSPNGKFLYTLDITNQNIITSTKDEVIVNTDVTHCVFNKTGKWMITAESRADELSSESRLKFWAFNEVKQTFVLNTDIELPHDNFGIHSMEISMDDVVATTGPDKKFKLWALYEVNDRNAKREVWSVLSVGTYRLLPCYAVDFSKDASLVAVSFGPVLTVWESEICALKCNLAAPFKRDEIRSIKFGNNELSHIVVTATENSLFSWNLITLCMLWNVSLSISLLVRDPFSKFMCLFSSKNTLFIFNPSSPNIEFEVENISKSKVIAANFTPNTNSNCGFSHLYFLNEDQELLCLEDENTEEEVASSFEIARNFTPFSAQVAQTTTSDVIKPQSDHLNITKLGSRYLSSILNSSAHTLPNPSFFCLDVLKSLILTTKVEISKESEGFNVDLPNNDAIETSEKSLVSDKKEDQDAVNKKDLLKAMNRLFT